ncbi:MAG TPA: acylneuraminate cytidylyltransferase family protein [Verrucomicrobiae bacterium]|nr:acylneuraminate cytidylyltransferase family protein [Verrucomicrobiae bacterium]
MTSPRVLGLVAARGGSKGLPRKNVLPLGGRPLIAWTVEAARAARALTRAIVSSDDAEILACAREAGAETPFVRPAALATDTASTLEVALHALDWLAEHERWHAEVLVLLPATAPLRRAHHIDAAVATLLADATLEAVVAVTEADYPPYWMLTAKNGRLAWLFPEGGRVARRQDLPTAFRPNGSIYAVRAAALREQRTFYPRVTAPYAMPREESVNIDSALDFRLAEILLARRPG